MNEYYTHREFLITELEKISSEKKSICLEFGVGHGSSPIFQDFLKKNINMNVISYESNIEWLDNIKNIYSEKNYSFIHTKNWDELLTEENFKEEYDLIFVDQTPWDARIKTIDIVGIKSKIVILHDYDFYNKQICEDIFSVKEGSFFYEKYSKNFNLIPNFEKLPPTLIMVNKLK